MDSPSLPLHECRTLKTNLIINRLHMFLTGIAISALFYYRATTLSRIIKTRETPLIPYVIVFISEIVLTCKWILRRPGRWRAVRRSVYPERLPGDEKLPAVDVFICTADPSKEPSLGVMNTVISAMALDYPADKLAVYLSDDGGSYVTLNAMREAWKFGKLWVPFCRRYNLKTRCPDAYFLENGKCSSSCSSSDFEAEKMEIENSYEEFKETLEKNSVHASGSVSRDHPPTVEVMNQEGMPYLVYVAREKRPSHPHHFKGGALNTLLKVSAVISNAPYFLVLDCDHYCNDPTSARQAMCFYLDPKISSKIAWVQFPQKFHNTSKHDIYTGQLHHVWREGFGWDGLMGPSIYGCNFYMSREAIYGVDKIKQDVSLLRKSFGSSNEFIKSIDKNYKPSVSRDGEVSDALQREIQLVASCTYDIDTKWGEEVGYAYFTVVEDSITSLNLHCRGWISVFVDPKRPCFLGSCTTNMNDMLVQQTRWSFGLTQIALSKYCPLFYGPSKMSVLQTMSYAAFTFEAVLYTVPFYGLGIIPQICLLHNIPLYPKVSDPYFMVFAFIFLSSQLKHLQEVLSYDEDSFMTSLYELRVWMMKSASCYFYATINAILDSIGLHEANFSLTNKVVDDEQVRRYEEGIYDFQVAPLLIIPCCSFYILNMISFTIGIGKFLGRPNGGELLVQLMLALFGIIVNYHLFEGMVLRQDKARISLYVSGVSVAVSAVVLCLGFLILI